MLAALISFEPLGGICFNLLSRFGFRLEHMDLRLPPPGKREAHTPFAGLNLDGLELRFGLRNGHCPIMGEREGQSR